MSNELLPPVRPLGRLNLHCCQFPFPMDDAHCARYWDRYAEYDAQIVYSQFAAGSVVHGVRRLGLQDKTIHVLSPPVPQVVRTAQVDRARQNDSRPDDDHHPAIILNVGRFTPCGHAKRQDVMIEAFRQLVARSSRPMELHLAGALGIDSNARDHLAALQKAANGLSVTFHVNVLPGQIHDLYRSAAVYWHLTGIGADPIRNPELFEHFGITIGEAMSAGCIPVVLRHGGPAEIITDGWNGYLIGSVDELIDRTMTVLAPERRVEAAAVATRAIARAAEFAPDMFAQRLLQIVCAA